MNRVYTPHGIRTQILASDHNMQVASHFGRKWRLIIVLGNVTRSNMDTDVRKYSNECNNSQSTKIPRHAKHGLIHLFEMARIRLTHISTNFTTDVPVSEEVTMIFMVVDRLTTMAHKTAIKKKDSHTWSTRISGACLEISWVAKGCDVRLRQDVHRTILSQPIHQQYVNRSGSHTQTSQTLPSPSPVLLSTFRCYQAPLELCKVLSDSASVFSGAPESTCTDGCSFSTLQELTNRIVKFLSRWDIRTSLLET
jgi:hypothetical protein